MGIEEEEVQAKRIHNIFNKIVTEIFEKVFAFLLIGNLQDTKQT
jgi:hypothetical protein